MDVFAAVADPTRRRLLEALRDGEHTVGRLVETLGIGQPTVSKHLRVLREARLVSSRVDAQRRRYRIEPTGVRELDEWVRAFDRVWTHRLDALETHLDRRTE
ncbi:ArsR/SmtB family transcription factor [Jatrophihabitans fulvus]